MNKSLPKPWEWATVADVADVQLGRQRSPQHHNGDQMRPYLRSANVTWGGISIEDVNEMNFDDADFAKYRLEPGDLLLNEASGSPNEVGKPAIWNGAIDDCCFQNTLLRLRPYELNRSYLYWYCYWSALMGRFGEAGRGVNIRHLGKRGLAQYSIPVAPLAEQERIVTAIEENLSRLDAAEAAVAAARGKTELLLRSARSDAFVGRWVSQPLETVAETQLGKMLSKKSTTGVGSTRYLRNRNVRWDVVDVSELAEMDFTPEERQKYSLRAGDVLICEGGAGVGRTAMWRDELESCCFQKALHRVRVGPALMPEFFAQFMRYLVESGGMQKHLSGVAIGHFPQEDLRMLEVPVPPIDDQRRVVEELQVKDAVTGLITRELDQADGHARALRRSILSAAFSGRLVTHDPIDEPASVLLQRIATERPPPKTRRKTSA